MCGLGRDWSCLGDVHWPEAAGDLEFSIKVVELNRGTPIPKALVKICASSDLDCSRPLGQGFTDSEGILPVQIQSESLILSTAHFKDPSFEGYIDVSGPSDEYYPTLNTLFPPQTQRRVVRVVNLPTRETVELLASILDEPSFEAAGIVVASVRDCANYPAPDVVVSLPSSKTALLHYWADLLPDTTLEATSSAGVAVAVDVGAGLPRLDGALRNRALPGVHTFAVVRPGTLSHAFLGPMP
jgi:hypothetical protein